MTRIDVDAVLRAVGERSKGVRQSPLGAKARDAAIASLCRRGKPGPLLEVLASYRVPNPTQDDPIEAALNTARTVVQPP